MDAGATLSAGATGPGALATGNLTFQTGGVLSAGLNAAGVSSLLNVTGSVSLSGADLFLQLLAAPNAGQTFTLLVNDGIDAISGQFNQGDWVKAIFAGREYTFRLDYAFNADGGSVGNDLAAVAVPGPVAGAGLPALLGIGVFLVGYARSRKRQVGA